MNLTLWLCGPKALLAPTAIENDVGGNDVGIQG